MASLTPSNTEIVAFLGLADALVAVDTFSDWPPTVEDAVDLGPDLQIDVDALAALDPDVVLAAESVPGMQQVVERVEAAGLDPLVLAPADLEGVRRDVRAVADALGVPERGEPLADAMAREVQRLREATEGAKRPRVHWEWWPDPTIVAGARGWMPEVLDAAGAANAYASLDAESPEVDDEQVREADPDVVALCWQGALHGAQSAEHLRERDAMAALDAVQAGDILEAPEHLFGRPGPRLVEGIRWLAHRLHPERAERLGDAYAWLPEGVGDDLPLADA